MNTCHMNVLRRMFHDAKAGINTVRIAESTWSTCEPQEGVFDFSHVIRVMDAMEKAGINVIIGTPTYAVRPDGRSIS